MKRDAAFFEGREPDLVYIARRLADAEEVESVLEAAGLEYGVEADTYQGGIVFRSERVGAFFYVLPDSGEAARAALAQSGFRPQSPEPAETIDRDDI